jgi:formylglycine-generating enzyme required for sulfatase activity
MRGRFGGETTVEISATAVPGDHACLGFTVRDVGRRLPAEPEWDMAARSGASRGCVWGDVFEWVAGSARLWPGAPPRAPGTLDTPPQEGCGVLRGASFATRPRWHHPQARRFTSPDSDTMFCGFRSCAV